MSTHHGFIEEFPYIRVDAFDGNPARVNPFGGLAPHFYLLTHAHSDHLVGLDSPNFDGKIYCTAVTKLLVLETMEAGERCRYDEKVISRKRKFSNLMKKKKSSNGKGVGRSTADQMEILEINVPRSITVDGRGQCTVTALDANHCPGSCMFLIEGFVKETHRAVLVTGDIRAESWWVKALSRNPAVSKYISPSRTPPPCFPMPAKASTSDLKGKGRAYEVDQWPRLDKIYLDTTHVLTKGDMLDKAEAVEILLSQMVRYPAGTKFFLNAWTWGYEDILKGVAKYFNQKIHVDEYKYRIYTHTDIEKSDPLLSSLCSAEPTHHTLPLKIRSSFQFHACERRWKCDEVWSEGIGSFDFPPEDLGKLGGPKAFKKKGQGVAGADTVVFVNPADCPRWYWDDYREKIEEDFDVVEGRAKGLPEREGYNTRGMLFGNVGLPQSLLVPLCRHSCLPELQHLVSIFQPQTIYPLTNPLPSGNSPAGELYRHLPDLFADVIAPGGRARLAQEAIDDTNADGRLKGWPMVSTVLKLPEGEVQKYQLNEATLDNLEGGIAVVEAIKKIGPFGSQDLGMKKRLRDESSLEISDSCESRSRKTSMKGQLASVVAETTISTSSSSSSIEIVTVPKCNLSSSVTTSLQSQQVIPNSSSTDISLPLRLKLSSSEVYENRSPIPYKGLEVYRSPFTSSTSAEIPTHLPKPQRKKVKFCSPTRASPSAISSSFTTVKPKRPRSPELFAPSLPSTMAIPTSSNSTVPTPPSLSPSSIRRSSTPPNIVRPSAESKPRRARLVEAMLRGIPKGQKGSETCGDVPTEGLKRKCIEQEDKKESPQSFETVSASPDRKAPVQNPCA